MDEMTMDEMERARNQLSINMEHLRQLLIEREGEEKAQVIIDSINAYINELLRRQDEASKTIDAFISSSEGDALKSLFPDAVQWIVRAWILNPFLTVKILPILAEHRQELRSHAPTLAELITDNEIMEGRLAQNNPLRTILDNADKAQDAPVLQIKRSLEKLDWPLDKVNSKAWNLPENKAGKLLKLAVEKAGSEKKINVLYSIDFKEAAAAGLQIAGKLDAYDQRVYTAVSSLYAYQGEYMTLAQIYYAMGYNSTPGAADKKKINDSLSKMMMAVISIDNTEESQVYKYAKIKYKANLLPLEIVTAIINGAEVDGVVHLTQRPPLYDYAVIHKQLTTISRAVLAGQLNKTEENLTIEAYLIERIARIKGGKGQRKILYKTIYEHARITTPKQRQRAKKKISQLLEHYQKTSFIEGWTQEQDGIFIK